MATQSHYRSEEEREINKKMQRTAESLERLPGVEFEWDGNELLAEVAVVDDHHELAHHVQDHMLGHHGVVVKQSGNTPSGGRYMAFKADA